MHYQLKETLSEDQVLDLISATIRPGAKLNSEDQAALAAASQRLVVIDDISSQNSAFGPDDTSFC